jgi:hypothetical protein
MVLSISILHGFGEFAYNTVQDILVDIKYLVFSLFHVSFREFGQSYTLKKYYIRSYYLSLICMYMDTF